MITKCYILDFDGTLIHEDLEREFMKFLLQQNEVKWRMLVVSLFTFPINMLRNKLGYPSVLKSWTYVLRNETGKYIDDFVKNYSVNRIHIREDVWQKWTEKDEVVLLSGCYQDLLTAYLQHINRMNCFTKIIGCEVEKNWLKVKRHPYGKGKCVFVDKSRYNIGIANEPVDRYYMELCNEQIYV